MIYKDDPNPAFWQMFDDLVATSEIVIDRPKGSAHPRMAVLIYPLDYGYLAGTTAGDGDGIDVWLGAEAVSSDAVSSHGASQVTAVACTVDRYKRDAELKVLVGCTVSDMQLIWHFLNEVATLPCIIIQRP